ncbi:MAG: electron transfer flavoprotein subunit alpha/FixB family protein [Sedimentisphaerales bacterium]|nr:electron transfer flavoprotein subunit alpha/FixB family protein [Sedimentisphaerales bacterium]
MTGGVWILAEQLAGRLQRVSFELLTRGIKLARQRACPLGAIVFGQGVAANDLQALIDCGADRVVVFDAGPLEHFQVEPYAACMLEVIERYQPEILIAGATTLGRTLMPYVAIKANAGLTADCTGLDIEPQTNNLLQTRPAIGGNIMATIKTPNHRPQMATVRPHSTPPAPRQAGRTGEIIKLDMAFERLTSRVQREAFEANPDKINLADADVIVAVGRGIKKAQNLPLIYELAEALGAAVGASRDVVDRGWLSYPHQIGLSGQTVSPQLYIAIGVSGTIQHIAGMQTAKTIVAINRDPEANIFKLADMGIVGDLFEVVPALIEKIKT